MLDKIAMLFGRPKSSPYQYRPGVASGIGVGVEGLGLMRPQSLPIDAPYDRRKTVQADLGPLQGGEMKWVQSVPNVSLGVNGAGITGQMALQALAEFQAGKQ